MKLKSKLTIGMLAVALIPLSISMGTLFSDNIKHTRKLTLEHATHTLELYAGEISSYFSQRITEVKTYARSPLIRSLSTDKFSPYLNNEIVYKKDDFEKFLIGRLDGHYYTTAGGNPYLGDLASFNDINPTARPKSIAKRDYWLYTVGENEFKQERSFVSNPMISYTTGAKQIIVATSILDENKKLIGMFGGSLPWENIETKINQLRRDIESDLPWDIRLFLISPKGIYWYHWDKSKIVQIKTNANANANANGEPILNKHGEKVSLKQKITDETNPKLAKIGHRMMNGEEGFSTFTDKLSDEKLTIFYAPVKNTGYSLGIQVPYSQINEPVVHQVRIQSFIVLVAVFLVVFFTIFLSRKIAGPICLLRDAADEIAIGNWDYSLPKSGNDEVSDLTRSFGLMITSITKTRKTLQDTIHELIQQKDTVDHHAIVSIADKHGNITYINNKFCEISGYTQDELIGNNHRILKSNVHPHEFYQDLWATISKGNIWQGRICNTRKDGSRYWVKSTISPFLDDMGIPYQYVSIRTDITELLEAKLEAEEASKAKSEFLSSMSHELRTPMNAVLGFSQLLLMKATDDDAKQSVNEILTAGEHLLELINQVLELSKIESGTLPLSIDSYRLTDLINDCLITIMPISNQQEIEINNKIDPLISSIVKVDKTQFRQIILNLLSNAIKYNQKDGKVSVDCLQMNDNLLRITISDTGKGLTPEQQTHIFKPFDRAGAENSHIPGTGLGLVISKDLIERMDGTIGFESEAGKGSCFWIQVPIS